MEAHFLIKIYLFPFSIHSPWSGLLLEAKVESAQKFSHIPPQHLIGIQHEVITVYFCFLSANGSPSLFPVVALQDQSFLQKAAKLHFLEKAAKLSPIQLSSPYSSLLLIHTGMVHHISFSDYAFFLLSFWNIWTFSYHSFILPKPE